MAKGSLKTPKKKQVRGNLLTILLAIQALFIFQSVLTDWSLASFFLLVINSAILVGLWKWKKWAAYAFFAYFIYVIIAFFMFIPAMFSYLLELAPDHSYSQKQIAFWIAAIIGIALYIGLGYLYYWAIKRKWQFFR